MPARVSQALSIAPIGIIASVVVVSLLAFASDSMRNALVLNPYRVKNKTEVHRLLTAGWLHADASHLGFNMLALYMFAEPSVRVLGDARFTALYVSAVIVGFIPTTLRHMNEPRYNSLGASGAVAAVTFSAILLDAKLKLYLMFIPIPVPGLVFAIGYLVYSAYRAQAAKDNINHGAHFTGALYGAALTYLFEPAAVEHTIRTYLH